MSAEAEPRSELDDAVLRAVVQASPDGLVIADASGRIVYANATMCQITGYDREDLIGRSVDDLVPTDLREAHGDHRTQFTRSPRTRPMGRGLPLKAVRKDGSETAVEISLSPIDGPTGVLTVASVRDITDRLEQSERLRSAAELLALSSERERIARDLHDTVLQRLFGLGLELQALGLRSDAVAAERIESAVDEIDLIIREIRTTVFTLGSAQRAGSLGAELGDVIAQATRVLGFTPRLRIDGPVESMVSPDVRIEMVASLREALGNIARHAHATEAVVELTVDDLVELSVRDNGVGLPPVFDANLGNGLKNLVSRAELLGGTCTIENSPSGGVTMSWRVPLPG